MRYRHILFAVLLVSMSFALNGHIYDISLDRVPNAVVFAYLNDTLVSRVIADSNGSYSMDIPRGTYNIVAYKPGTNLFSNDTLNVYSDNQTFDIVLSDTIPYENISEDIPLPDLGELSEEQPYVEDSSSNTHIWVVFGLIGGFVSFGLVLLKRRRYKPKDKDVELVLRIIKENGGQIMQSKIVEKTGWSEAKVSLILSHLKKQGMIKKKRFGRKKAVYLVGEKP